MPGVEWVVPPSVSMYANQAGMQNYSVSRAIHHKEATFTLTRVFNQYTPVTVKKWTIVN